MKLQIPIVETIKKRHSVRTYENKALMPQDRTKILAYMKQLANPFGISLKKYMIDKTIDAKGEKLGTYGVIKGANTFLGISVPDEKFAAVAAGYEFENLILYATSLGLGTVWLAATFNRDSFASAMKIPEDEILPVISPVGYPAAKQSITESLMRTAMKSSARKEWNELFYQEDFNAPLTKNMAGAYAVPLEMVRLAPSAKNIQPWRIRKDDKGYHFYVAYKSDLSEAEAMIKQIDIGIALSHFHQAAMELGLTGHFEKLPEDQKKLPEHMHYIISWCME